MVKIKALEDPDDLMVRCNNCRNYMVYTTFGRAKDEVYRCPECDKMVYKDHLDISIMHKYIKVTRPDGSNYQ